VPAEYAVLVQRAVEHKVRLAAVLLADVDLPPFLNTRVAADFRNCRSEQDYRQRLDRLERALRRRHRLEPASVQDEFDVLGEAHHELGDRRDRLGPGQPFRLLAQAVVKPDEIGRDGLEYGPPRVIAQLLILGMKAIDNATGVIGSPMILASLLLD
jgi:hypothetical protein